MLIRLSRLTVLEDSVVFVVGLPNVVKIGYVEVLMLGPVGRSAKHRS